MTRNGRYDGIFTTLILSHQQISIAGHWLTYPLATIGLITLSLTTPLCDNFEIIEFENLNNTTTLNIHVSNWKMLIFHEITRLCFRCLIVSSSKSFLISISTSIKLLIWNKTQCKIRVNLGSTNFDCIFFNIWNFIAIFLFCNDTGYLSK